MGFWNKLKNKGKKLDSKSSSFPTSGQPTSSDIKLQSTPAIDAKNTLQTNSQIQQQTSHLQKPAEQSLQFESTVQQTQSEKMDISQLSRDKLIELVRKNCSKKPEDRLTEAEIMVLKEAREQLSPEAWAEIKKAAKQEQQRRDSLKAQKEDTSETKQAKSTKSDELVLEDLSDNAPDTQQKSSETRNLSRLNELLTASRLKEQLQQEADEMSEEQQSEEQETKQEKQPQQYESKPQEQYSETQDNQEGNQDDELEYTPEDKYETEEQMHQEQLSEPKFDQQDEGLMRYGTRSMTPPRKQKPYYSDYINEHDTMRSTGVRSMPPRDRQYKKEQVYTKLLEIQKAKQDLDEQEKALRDEIERSAQSDYIHEKLFDESDRLGSYPLPEESELSLRRDYQDKLHRAERPYPPSEEARFEAEIFRKVNLISAKQKLLHLDFMQLRNTVHKSLTEFKVELKELQEELSLWRQRLTLPVQQPEIPKQTKPKKSNVSRLLPKETFSVSTPSESNLSTDGDSDSEYLEALGKPKLKLFIRLRPLNTFYKASVQIVDNNSIEIISGFRRKLFTFDKIYAPLEGQDEIWDHVSNSPALMLAGKESCFIAYGETGSGKTYTIRGTSSHPGILPRFMVQLFAEVEKKSDTRNIRVKISAVEMKANYFRDLLSAKSNYYTKNLPPQNVTKVKVSNFAEYKAIIRAVETAQNPYKFRGGINNVYSERNPRAHLIITVYVEQQGKALLDEHESHCTFVELGGSELLDRSRGKDAIAEYKHLERNFMGLCDVLNAMLRRAPLIPYRNSRLTMFLQDILQPETNIYVYICTFPSKEHYTENMRSLKYANRIKTTRNASAIALKSEYDDISKSQSFTQSQLEHQM